MYESKIAVRYAQALYQAAREENCLSEVLSDANQIINVYSNEDFRLMLESPIIKSSDKTKVFNQLFSARLSPLSMQFLYLLLSNKRETSLPHIIRNFKALYRKGKGILEAELVVSSPLEKRYLDTFKDILTKAFNSEIELKEVVRPSIIGGFILRVEDEQFDGSVSSGLKKIKKQLLESSI